jgi:hypothetical protein
MDVGATTARALVWRPTAVPGEFQFVATTPDAAIPAGQAPSFPAAIPVRPGDVLGVRSGLHNMRLVFPSSSPSDVLMAVPGEAPIGATVGAPTSSNTSATFPQRLVNVSATLTTTVRKCKKRKHRSASSAGKRKCKKRHR